LRDLTVERAKARIKPNGQRIKRLGLLLEEGHRLPTLELKMLNSCYALSLSLGSTKHKILRCYWSAVGVGFDQGMEPGIANAQAIA
jgi:hypothetical protein